MYNTKEFYKYHYLYKVTNSDNGKYYIGIHSTNEVDDNYMGSGVDLIREMRDIGADKFYKEILHLCDSREELLELETLIVDADMVSDSNTYNKSIGGMSYIDTLINIDDKDAFISHQSKAGKIGGRVSYDKKTPEEKIEWHKKGRAASSGTKGMKLNIKDPEKYSAARKAGAHKRKRYNCHLCDKPPLDGGNYKRHLMQVHKLDEQEYLELKANQDA